MPQVTPADPDIPSGLPVWKEGTLEDGQELAGVEVRRPQWSGRSCRHLRLDGVSIVGGDLSEMVLLDPSLRDVIVRDANLANATFRGGSLRRIAAVSGRLIGARFDESELEDTVWRDCAGAMASFRHAELVRVTFEDCILQQADFMGARCSDVRFHGCDLSGASFSHARFRRSELRGCRLGAVEGVDGLRGTAMELEQVLSLAPQLAAALGIQLLCDD